MRTDHESPQGALGALAAAFLSRLISRDSGFFDFSNQPLGLLKGHPVRRLVMPRGLNPTPCRFCLPSPSTGRVLSHVVKADDLGQCEAINGWRPSGWPVPWSIQRPILWAFEAIAILGLAGTSGLCVVSVSVTGATTRNGGRSSEVRNASTLDLAMASTGWRSSTKNPALGRAL